MGLLQVHDQPFEQALPITPEASNHEPRASTSRGQILCSKVSESLADHSKGIQSWSPSGHQQRPTPMSQYISEPPQLLQRYLVMIPERALVEANSYAPRHHRASLTTLEAFNHDPKAGIDRDQLLFSKTSANLVDHFEGVQSLSPSKHRQKPIPMSQGISKTRRSLWWHSIMIPERHRQRLTPMPQGTNEPHQPLLRCLAISS